MPRQARIGVTSSPRTSPAVRVKVEKRLPSEYDPPTETTPVVKRSRAASLVVNKTEPKPMKSGNLAPSLSTVDDPDDPPSTHCVLDGCTDEIEADLSDLRYHYISHYYKEAVASSLDRDPLLCHLDTEDKAEFEETFKKLGQKKKYSCVYKETCTKRVMNFWEFSAHNLSSHHQVKKLLQADTRPGMDGVLAQLYPGEVKVEQEAKGKPEQKPEEEFEDQTDADIARSVMGMDRVHDCLLCSQKEGQNLTFGNGLNDLKYHYSVCYYDAGKLVEFISPGKENLKDGNVIDEVDRFRYKCPFPKCVKNEGKPKLMGYKEYAIHCGTWHNIVELVMEADREHNLKDVLRALKSAREKSGRKGEVKMLPVQVEEVHACLLCKGKDNKEAQNLSLDGERAKVTRYHYAQCYYGEGVYWSLYSPGKNNTDSKGRPVDEVGASIKYACIEKGCDATKKRKMGYKEFCIHSSNLHGGLLKILKKDERKELRELAKKFAAIPVD